MITHNIVLEEIKQAIDKTSSQEEISKLYEVIKAYTEMTLEAADKELQFLIENKEILQLSANAIDIYIRNKSEVRNIGMHLCRIASAKIMQFITPASGGIISPEQMMTQMAQMGQQILDLQKSFMSVFGQGLPKND